MDGRPASPDSRPGGAPRPHVLCIVDDCDLLELVVRCLERRGHRVSGFSDPGKAGAALRSAPGRYDLLIVDFDLPWTGAAELAHAARAVRPDLPLVLIMVAPGRAPPTPLPEARIAAIVEQADALRDLPGVVDAVFAPGRSAAP